MTKRSRKQRGHAKRRAKVLRRRNEPRRRPQPRLRPKSPLKGLRRRRPASWVALWRARSLTKTVRHDFQADVRAANLQRVAVADVVVVPTNHKHLRQHPTPMAMTPKLKFRCLRLRSHDQRRQQVKLQLRQLIVIAAMIEAGDF